MKALLFDLDDTLYSERDFVASGFLAVARYAGANHRCDDVRVFRYMMNVFANHGRQRVLPMMIQRFLDPSVPLAELVRGKARVVLLVDDNSRTTPIDRMLPPVLDELRGAGVRDG